MNGTVVKSWSSTQATTAQSSGEAEFYAVVRAAAEGLGIKAIMEDMGYEVEVRVHSFGCRRRCGQGVCSLRRF